MPLVFEEGRLRFTFSNDWLLVRKWDEHEDYTQGLGRHPQTKAVDFLGLHFSGVWFIEVKDFRGHRTENKERMAGPLADEVASKVRDTWAGLIWACERQGFDDRKQIPRFLEPLLQREAGTKVPTVLWLELDRPLLAPQRAVLTDQIKRRLKWAGVRVLVTDLRAFQPEEIPGVEVVNLQHPSPP